MSLVAKSLAWLESDIVEGEKSKVEEVRLEVAPFRFAA